MVFSLQPDLIVPEKATLSQPKQFSHLESPGRKH